MKRILAIATVIFTIFSICSCVPNNVLTPNPEQEVQTGTPSEQTQNQTQKPEEPKTEEQPLQEKDEKPEKTEKNTAIDSSFDIDLLEYVSVKTADLKDKKFSFYVGSSSFFAGEMTESQWIKAIGEKYGFTADIKVTSDSRLFESQQIAQKTGTELDLISVKLDNMAAAITLCQSTKEFVTNTGNNPFSQKVFELSDGRLFAGKGNGKMLWYNKSIIKEAPAENWVVSDLDALLETAKSANASLLQTEYTAEFGSCNNVIACGYDYANGYVVNLNDASVRNSYKAFAELMSKEGAVDSEKMFSKGNVAFEYTAFPVRAKREISVEWAPLPKYDVNGTSPVSLCGSAIGISKTAKAENVPAALTFAMLWSARYTEYRQDTLVFDLGLSKPSAEKYITLCETDGKIYSADKQINEYTDSSSIGEFLYDKEQPETAEPETESEQTEGEQTQTEPENTEPTPDYISICQQRADLINARYR